MKGGLTAVRKIQKLIRVQGTFGFTQIAVYLAAARTVHKALFLQIHTAFFTYILLFNYLLEPAEEGKLKTIPRICRVN